VLFAAGDENPDRQRTHLCSRVMIAAPELLKDGCRRGIFGAWQKGETCMRWKTSSIAVAAAVVLSAATMTTGAVAHGGHGGGGFGGHGFGGHSFGSHAFFAGRFAHFDHDRFHHFRFRRHFFFAGIAPGFYDWPYGYSSCRVLTPRGWVWVCQ
jgi:hypothetical protein